MLFLSKKKGGRTVKKSLTITLNQDIYEKLKKAAQQEGRFVSRQAAYWIRQSVYAYEKEHGDLKEDHVHGR